MRMLVLWWEKPHRGPVFGRWFAVRLKAGTSGEAGDRMRPWTERGRHREQRRPRKEERMEEEGRGGDRGKERGV